MVQRIALLTFLGVLCLSVAVTVAPANAPAAAQVTIAQATSTPTRKPKSTPKPKHTATPKPTPKASAKPSPKASAKPSPKPSKSPKPKKTPKPKKGGGAPPPPKPPPPGLPPIYRDVTVVLCVGQSVSIYEKDALQGLLPPVIYGPLDPSPPGSNVASGSLHNTMTSASTVVITGNNPGDMTFTQEIDWPTGIQNPHQQYQKYIVRFRVKVKLCPSPNPRAHVPPTPRPVVSEGPGAVPSEAPSPGGPPPPPPGRGMEVIHAKPHNITLCVGQTTEIYEPEVMQGLLPPADYGSLTPNNSSVASASLHNTMSSEATVVITGLSPGQVTFTQEVLWPTGVMSPRQQYVKIIVTFNVTVRDCATPRPVRAHATPSPKPTDPPIPEDPNFSPVQPQPQDGSGSESGWYAPPAAGPSSEITATVEDTTQSGPLTYYVELTDNKQHKTFWRGVTDAAHHLHLRLPEIAGGIAAVMLFDHFDRHGDPDIGGETHVGEGLTTDTQPVPNAPASNPAITQANSAYERGGSSNGEITLRARGIDPLDTHVVADGNQTQVDTLATSDQSVVARLHDDIGLGRHTFALESDGRTSNRFPADVVAIRIDPVPPSDVGEVQTITAHFDGLPAGDRGVAEFSVGGPVQLMTGGSVAEVPVQDGIARIQIRRIAPGSTFLHVHLKVSIAGFWSL